MSLDAGPLLFSCSVVSNSLWPQGLQHARFPCPSLSPRVCSNSCQLSQWTSASVLPVNIQSFRIDWFDLLAVQGTLKSLLQHHSLKTWIHSAQPSFWSNSHIHTWLLENHSFALLAKWCLLFNTLSRFVIAFLPRSSIFLISWLHSQLF